MAKFFLIGGAGFIGSYVSRQLLREGDEVVIYDSFLNYVNPFKSNYQNILKMRFEGILDKITIVRGDIRHKGHLLRSLKEHNPEIVIHFAALPIATKSNEFPEDATGINLDGVVNVLEAIREIGKIKRYVFTSSSFVYGDFEYEPADEKHPTTPIDVYGGTKLCGEILVKSYARKFGLKYTIIRPSAVYGPGDANRRVSQAFMDNALNEKPLKLFNGGTEKIDLTYVSDVAAGFIAAAKSNNAINETFNITRGDAKTVKELAEIIKKSIPSVKVIETPSDMERPKRGSLDISKAKKLLGWEPKVSLEEGIEKYFKGIKEEKIVE